MPFLYHLYSNSSPVAVTDNETESPSVTLVLTGKSTVITGRGNLMAVTVKASVTLKLVQIPLLAPSNEIKGNGSGKTGACAGHDEAVLP